MNTLRSIQGLGVALAVMLWPDTILAAATVTSAMSGHWEGNAQVIVTWCRQKTLPVTLEIKPDGSVTGKVGDATLSKARLRRNRRWLGRKLHLKTDYIITGNLDGAIVAGEGIRRERVSIPLHFHGNTFSGGLHTSGTKLGGKENMILSARLDLARSK